jgi:hypothetical protein
MPTQEEVQVKIKAAEEFIKAAEEFIKVAQDRRLYGLVTRDLTRDLEELRKMRTLLGAKQPPGCACESDKDHIHMYFKKDGINQLKWGVEDPAPGHSLHGSSQETLKAKVPKATYDDLVNWVNAPNWDSQSGNVRLMVADAGKFHERNSGDTESDLMMSARRDRFGWGLFEPGTED